MIPALHLDRDRRTYDRKDGSSEGVIALSGVEPIVEPNDTTKPREASPFGMLLGSSSLILAILFVAGFSYRWSYYYNFGLRYLALQVPVQSTVIGAIDLVRTPANF